MSQQNTANTIKCNTTKPSLPRKMAKPQRIRPLFLCATLFGLLICSGNNFVEALPSPFADAMISHSGPTNALWGHEKLVPEKEQHERQKRQVYFGGYGGWQSPALMAAGPPDGYQQLWITSEHNRYRRMVPATNMRMVYWSEELARSAQAHANTCDFRHSRNRVNIGENIWAAPYYNYSDAIQRWYSEVNNPWCGCSTGYKHCCGHFIQLVWSQTNLIGCGYAQCNGVIGVGGYGRAVFVCHYNPQGNKVMYQSNGELYAFPAYNWAYSESQRCSECPADQPVCHEGLCYMPLNYQTTANVTTAPTVAPPAAAVVYPNYYQQQQQQQTVATAAPVAVQQQPAQVFYPNYPYYQQQQVQQQQQSALDKQLETNKVDIRRRMMMQRRMMRMRRMRM